ncbi:MAG: hypothetical protein PVSMB7_17760 [Chloroflexota bacterium]
MSGDETYEWNFLFVEQLALFEGGRATVASLTESLADGDHERFAFVLSKLRDTLPRMVRQQWVNVDAGWIALAFKGRVAAGLHLRGTAVPAVSGIDGNVESRLTA